MLQRFLEAWCEENGVDIRDDSAADVAAALIDWYRFDLGDRNLLKPEPPEVPPEPKNLRRLLRQLGDT